MRSLAILASMLCLAAAASAAPPRPGSWRVTSKMVMPGKPVPPPTTQTVCLSQADLSSGKAFTGNRLDCRQVHYRRANDAVSWEVVCSDGNRVLGKVQTTATSYQGISRFVGKGRQVVTQISAQRLGECR